MVALFPQPVSPLFVRSSFNLLLQGQAAFSRLIRATGDLATGHPRVSLFPPLCPIYRVFLRALFYRLVVALTYC